MERKAITKRLRFKIFKRDEFSCQYCGRTPELHNITLEVDHLISVKNGGGNEEENLTTSCFDCNRGKRGDSIVRGSLEKTKNELLEIKERLEQIKYIAKLKDNIRKKQKDIEDNKLSFIDDIMKGYKIEFIYKMKIRIKNQNKKYMYSLELLRECLEITEAKFCLYDNFYIDDYFRYFHGVLNGKLKDFNK